MRILQVAAELFPYVKVGGLADVMGALPQALMAEGADVRLLLPAYPALREGLETLVPAGDLGAFGESGGARLLQGRTGAGIPLYLLDLPSLFDRPGGPYAEQGDSHLRFGALSWAAARLGRHGDAKGWRPQVLQAHDWQAGLAPAYLALEGGPRPATVMTIHNLAYQGRYPAAVLPELGLPVSAFHLHGLEFHGDLGFLKAGLVYADRLTTVSPTYAREIQTPELGEGLQGLLAHRAEDLAGILNGVDPDLWHPSRSPHLPMHFAATRPSGKKVCKNHLQRELGLRESPAAPLFGIVSRFAVQKGLDLALENVDHLVAQGAQLAVLGSGDPALEAAFRAAAARHPGAVGLRIGYDEGLSHRIIAGSDALLVPSRHEPCGLTQLYALAFGTLPVVRRTGGLADTVVDGTPEAQAEGRATGFVFDAPNGWALGEALNRACGLYRDHPAAWTRMQRTAMAQDFSWRASARQHMELFRALLHP